MALPQESDEFPASSAGNTLWFFFLGGAVASFLRLDGGIPVGSLGDRL